MEDSEVGAFIKKERQRFIVFVRTLLRDASEIDPEDVLHDVLARLLGRPNLDLPLDQMTAYIFRSLRNRVVDHMRTRTRHVSIDEDIDDDDDAPQPTHELEGASLKELASRLRMPLNTLLSHKSRAMKKLEKHFHSLGEPP